MKITGLKATAVSVPYAKPRLWALGGTSGATKTIVEIATDEDINGVGETLGASPKGIIERQIAPILIGQDPSNIQRLIQKAGWRTGWSAINTPGSVPIAAIEMALWDIKGKATDRPVCDLLGGKLRNRIKFIGVIQTPASSKAPIAEENAPDLMAREVEEARERYGFDTIQIYLGVFSPETDIRIVNQVRKQFGPFLKIAIDVNRSWSPETAIRTLDKMKECSLHYVEDATAGLEALARVRRTVGIPFSTHYKDAAEIARSGAADVIAGDVHDCGGFLGTKELIAQCKGANLGFWFHSANELGIATASMMHVIASSPHIIHPSQTVIHWFVDDIITEKFKLKDGMIELPDLPGLGVEIDKGKLKKYAEMFRLRGEFGYHDPDTSRPDWVPQIAGV